MKFSTFVVQATTESVDKRYNLLLHVCRYMFGAVAAHKFVIAFCIGVELIASKTRRYLSVIYVVTFAVVSPIGIGVGMLLVGGGSAAASGPMAVILQASFAIWEFAIVLGNTRFRRIDIPPYFAYSVAYDRLSITHP